jgi:hypothetical protein
MYKYRASQMIQVSPNQTYRWLLSIPSLPKSGGLVSSFKVSHILGRRILLEIWQLWTKR